MMKKKEYQKPQVEVILLKNNFRMMAGSEKTIPLVEEETPIQF